MSADVRTVATDALETLGHLITEKERRDAIHLAVEPIVAGVLLTPGTHVGIKSGKAWPASEEVKALGIVDPFLDTLVMEGERFWLIVYPRKINSLRHVWTCPGFPPSEFETNEIAKIERAKEKVDSENWLRDFCNNNDGPSYDQMIDLVEKGGSVSYGDQNISINGDCISVYGNDASGQIPSEFWDHMKNVTGIMIDTRPSYFSCSC